MAAEKAFSLQVVIEGVDKFTPMFKKMKEMQQIMGPTQKQVDNTTKSLKNLGNSSTDVNKLNNSLKEMQSYQNGMKQLNEGFNSIKNTLIELGVVAASSKALKELFGLAEKAGQIQMKNIELGGIYGLDATSEQMKEINKQANELSNKTLFSTKDILEINTELAHAQVTLQNLAKVVPEATYFAEVEVGMGKSGSAKSSAYNVARMAEDSGISSDTTKMSDFMDKMYRVVNVTHATSESMGETFKMGMPVVKNLGWDYNDMLQAGAYAAVNGMEGTMAGTHIKDFAERINPLKPMMANNQKILAAMAKAGFIDGIHTSVGKTGKIEITGFDSASLMKDKDHLKSYMEMTDVLEKKHDDFIASNGNSNKITSTMTAEELKTLKDHHKELTGNDLSGGELEWAALMNRIFGEQGQDFAIISAHRQKVDKLNKSLEAQSSLEEQTKKIRDSFIGQLHILESNFQNVGMVVGNQLLPDLTNFMNELAPKVAKVKDWLQAHEELAKKITEITAGIAAGILVFASASLAIKTFGAIFGPLTKNAKDFYTLFKTSKLTQSSMMEMRANVVNLYGAEINGGGGGGVPIGGGGKGGKGGGMTVGGGGLPTRSARQAAERAANPTLLKTVGSGTAKAFEAGFKSLKVALPVSLAFGAYDVVTAPEGHKVETAVKHSGGIMGGWAGAEAGAALGATIGSVVPGLGTVIGGAIGGIAGGIIGATVGEKVTTSAWDAVHKFISQVSFGQFAKEHPEENVAHNMFRLTQIGQTVPSGPPFAKHALGGIFNAPHLGMVAEAGPEAIIPLSNRSRGLSLWQQAGAALGMGGGGGGNVTIHNVEIKVDGADKDPKAVAREVMNELGKLTRGMSMNMGTHINIGAM